MPPAPLTPAQKRKLEKARQYSEEAIGHWHDHAKAKRKRDRAVVAALTAGVSEAEVSRTCNLPRSLVYRIKDKAKGDAS